MDNKLIGIDFGTTHTVVSIYENNKPNIIKINNNFFIPSKIGKYNNIFYCGFEIPELCNNIIHSFKLDIGNNKKKYIIDNEEYNNQDLLNIFFKYIIDNINLKNICAIITVPSHFYDNQRNIIKNTFESLNVNVLRLLNEPTAAAISYGLNFSSSYNEKILIIDIGGGTTDFTVLEKTETFFETLYSYGINDLGGNNFTKLLVNEYKINWLQAEIIKKELSYIDFVNISNNINISRDYFNIMATPLIKKIKNVLFDIIALYKNIDYIILVGGSCRIPLVQSCIKEITNITPWLYPEIEYAVSYGACLYASILKNEYKLVSDILLLDILPLSLGVELADGSYSIIVPKNTPLPTKMSKKYTTDLPDSEFIIIKLFQGEKNIAKNNYFLGDIKINKNKTDSNPIIEIEYKIDINSLISINAINKKTGDNKNIIINYLNNDNNNYNSSDDYDELQRIKLIYNLNILINNINLINKNYISELNINNINNMDNIEIISIISKLEKYINNENNLIPEFENINSENDNNYLQL